MEKRTKAAPMNLLDSTSVSLASAQVAVPLFGLALLVPLWSHGRAAAGHAARLMAAALVFAVTAATVVAVQGSVD